MSGAAGFTPRSAGWRQVRVVGALPVQARGQLHLPRPSRLPPFLGSLIRDSAAATG